MATPGKSDTEAAKDIGMSKDDLIKSLAESQKVVTQMMAQLASLTEQVTVLTQQNLAGSVTHKPKTFDEPVPKVNHKDVDKPQKLSGDKWAAWEPDSKNFLVRIDVRWKKFLDTIEVHSKKPLGGD